MYEQTTVAKTLSVIGGTHKSDRYMENVQFYLQAIHDKIELAFLSCTIVQLGSVVFGTRGKVRS
jgi:hypothetical protein